MFPNQTNIDDSYDLLGNVNDEALESVDMSLDDFNKGKGKEKVDGKNENGFQLVCTPLSIFADVVDLGAMGVVMVEDVMIFTKDWPILKAFSDGIGVAVYAFEG
ncbi:hypothetical protein Q3G72_006956 [Acer saccharum]|nr:hypothetical protein Q3G72_006956 [Acer saccharum]